MNEAVRASSDWNRNLGRHSRVFLRRSAWLATWTYISACAFGCEGNLSAQSPERALDKGKIDHVLDSTYNSGDGDPSHPIVGGNLRLSVEPPSSTSVRLGWPSPKEGSSITVEVGTEPPDASGVLPLPVASHTLRSTATEFVLEHVAAGTDVFFRVNVVTGNPSESNATQETGFAHVRIPGGPGVQLDTALREVHAVARDMLSLALEDPATHYDPSRQSFSGNHGDAWQSGTWMVTRSDGTEIPVRNVYRQSMPVGQPDYPVGYEQFGDGNIIHVQHIISLELGEEIGNRELLTVQHLPDSSDSTDATRLSVLIPFSDHYLETSSIQLNQVGYNPDATTRWAYASAYVGDGGSLALSRIGDSVSVLSEPHNALNPRTAVVETLALNLRAELDTASGGPVGEIDLSSVPAAESTRYRILVPGVGVSYPTSVSHEASLRSFYTVARGMFLNRWCGSLGSEYTDWPRPEDHCEAYFVTGTHYTSDQFGANTPKQNLLPVRGGHHDAGDFDIRPFHVLVAQYLLRAFEMGPNRFFDDQLHTPESGNTIPDLLDEALWSLAAWEDLQNADGSIRAGVESDSDPRGIYPANADQLPYWTFEPEPWHTAYVAALFAQAARLVRPFDVNRSTQLEQRARLAYNASIVATAPAAYRLYAASELAALTNETQFYADFEARWNELDAWGKGAFDRMLTMKQIYPGSFIENTPTMADFVMGYAQSAQANESIRATILSEMQTRADAAASAILDSPLAHRNGRSLSDVPDWGRSTSTGRHADAIYQALQLGNLPSEVKQRYFDAMSVAADYALGANPLGMSFITGLGSRSPQQPLHLDSLSWLANGKTAIPGIPVFGPVQSLPGLEYYAPVENAFYPTFGELPIERRFADSRTSVNTSEFTIWEMQAPMTELFASLLGPTMQPPSSWRPGQAHHASALTDF